MSILVTGVAGFIGMHTAESLLSQGHHVVGIDNINNYYDPRLKEERLNQLKHFNNFSFMKLDFAVPSFFEKFINTYPDIDQVIHLGAQAGVRNSIKEPHDYMNSNLAGQLNILEYCRKLMERNNNFKKLIYASSSSVYGANAKIPFSVHDKTDHPVSFYGATKKACEVMTHSYSSLYKIPSIGLRFFTVYGPWGRPDMSPYLFTKSILEGKEINVFNNGDMRRDFTFVDDVVEGIIGALGKNLNAGDNSSPHKIYNLGNNKPVKLMDYIQIIEKTCCKKANLKLLPMQPGDVFETYADIEISKEELGFVPKTDLNEGIRRFVEWFQQYHK